MGLDFITHTQFLIDHRDIEYDAKVGTTSSYPDLLTIAHVYSHYKATKAIEQIPSEHMPAYMASAADGLTPLKLAIDNDDQRNIRNFLQRALNWESN